MTSTKRKQREAAIDAEIAEHRENGTWKIIRRGLGMKTVGSKWLFVAKKNERGSVIRFNSRIVALDYSLTFGVMLFEAYSHVSNASSIRLIFTICSHFDNVVLQTMPTQRFWTRPSAGRVHGRPQGCRRARRLSVSTTEIVVRFASVVRWVEPNIHRELVAIGFVPSNADRCVYALGWLYARVHSHPNVDDTLMATKSRSSTIPVVSQ